MTALPSCPKCQSGLTYEDGNLLVCPECAHEWSASAPAPAAAEVDQARVVRDAFGTPLADGDSVTVIKDLKILPNLGNARVRLPPPAPRSTAPRTTGTHAPGRPAGVRRPT